MKGNLPAAAGWQLLEVVRRPDVGRGFVVSDELQAEPVGALRHVRRELRALRAAGIPPDSALGAPDVERIVFTCPDDRSSTTFYVLKCKPGHWRLYFVADANKRRITFLFAVAKKTQRRDTDDVKKCCARLKEYEAQTNPVLGSLDYLCS